MAEGSLLFTLGNSTQNDPDAAVITLSAPTATPQATESSTDAPEVLDLTPQEGAILTPEAGTPTEGGGEKKEVVPPSALQDIQDKFGGRWKLIRSDPYDEYLKAVGVGLVHRKVASKTNPELHISVKDDKIYMNLQAPFYNQNYVFELDKEMENLVEKSRQGVFSSYKDGKLTLQMTPLDEGWNKTQEVEHYNNSIGEHVVVHATGSAVCRRYFTKLLDVVYASGKAEV